MPYSVPTTFTTATTLTATALNQNFDDAARKLSGNLLPDSTTDAAQDLVRGSSLFALAACNRTVASASFPEVWARRRLVSASGETFYLVRVDAHLRLFTGPANVQVQIRNNAGTNMLTSALALTADAELVTTTAFAVTSVATGDNVEFATTAGDGGTDLQVVSWWRIRHQTNA